MELIIKTKNAVGHFFPQRAIGKVQKPGFLFGSIAGQPADHLLRERRVAVEDVQEFRSSNNDQRRVLEYLGVVGVGAAADSRDSTDAVAGTINLRDEFFTF